MGTHQVFFQICSICSMRVQNKEKLTNFICFSNTFNYFLIVTVTEAHVRKSGNTKS